MTAPGAHRPPIVLASASPRRRELLAALDVPFVVRPANVDETPPAGLDPAGVALAIARRKAAAASASAGGQLVLAADTVVALEGCLLGKPADAAEARAMLERLSGRTHDVYTAIVLVLDDQRCEAVPLTRVSMRQLSASEIAASIAAGTPFDKAGGYAIQDPLLAPVARWEGCYCNVVGLPLWSTWQCLRTLLPDATPRPPDTAFERCAACPLRQRI